MKVLKEKGITLVALVVTIIILLILAGVTIRLVIGDDGLLKRTQEAVEKYDNAQKKEESQIGDIESTFKDFSQDDKEEDGRVKVNKPKLADGMIPIKYNEEKKKWVITNENDKDWYDYSEGKMLWANIMLSDGKYKQASKNYNEDGTTEVEESDLGSMFVWVPRYAYSFNSYHTEMNNGEGTTQRITNVVFLNGTSNKDFKDREYQTTYDPTKAEEGKPTPTVVHPGFKFGEQELTGIWVAKFEASMSGTEASLTADNDIKIEPTAQKFISILPNVDAWRYINIGYSFINCLNMKNSGNVYGILSTQVDTHLMKNIEWGAASYLAASQYGNMPTVNDSMERDGDVIHEYTGKQNYIGNATQSTTRNVTGIYDMCGGSWERVAAYYDNLDQNLLDFGTEEIFKETKNGIILKEEYTKYWDKYEVDEKEKNVTKGENGWRNTDIWKEDGSKEANQKRIDITKKRYELMGRKTDGTNGIGDALYEVIKDYSYCGVLEDNKTWNWIQVDKTTASESTWGLGFYNNDCTLIGHTERPFPYRGGIGMWGNTDRCGIFALGDGSGSKSESNGFRPVITI